MRGLNMMPRLGSSLLARHRQNQIVPLAFPCFQMAELFSTDNGGGEALATKQKNDGEKNSSPSSSTALEVKQEMTLIKSPKVEALFNRIKQNLSSKEEVKIMNSMILDMLGIPANDEFYNRTLGGKKGIGGKSSGGGGGGGEGGEAAAESAKTTFDVNLVSFDSKSKIKLIKEIRAAAELGLKEAKELVDSAPKVVKKNLSREQAEELKKKLEDLGATIELV